MLETLGEFEDALEELEADRKISFLIPHGDAKIYPISITSWRGVYENAALTHGPDPITVGQLLTNIQAAYRGTFYGWKGGEYTYDRNTPFWIANPGTVGEARVEKILNVGDYEYLIQIGYGPY